MPKPKILVVEDEFLVRDIIVLELEEAGFTVLEAATGEEALALLERDQAIDLIFTDIRLPGRVDGWDIACAARRVQARVPVIYATGYSEDTKRRVDDSVFLVKPYRAQTVIAAAEQLGVKTG